MPCPTLVVLNPASRNGATGARWRAIEPRVRTVLGPLDVSTTLAPRDAVRIAREAAKQAFRPVTPEVAAPIDLNALCRALPGHQLALVPWEDAREGTLPQLISPDIADLAIVIGPEGGMGESEVQRMLDSGARAVTLGPRIFRTETAGLAAIIAAMALSGNLE